MLNLVANALGINTLKVQTHLNNDIVEVGKSLRGAVHITGTTSDKTINHLDLHLMTFAKNSSGDSDIRQTHTLGSVRLTNRCIIKAHDSIHIPFELALSLETPITEIRCPNHQTKLWLHTDLDVAGTIDSSDKDTLRTTPNPVMARFLSAMNELGFRLKKCDVELGSLHTPYGRSSFGCYQEFEYGAYSLKLNSVEVSFYPKNHQIHVVLEIDRPFHQDSYQLISLDNSTTTMQMVTMIRQCLAI